MKDNGFYIFILFLFFVSCTETKKQSITPWGTSVDEDSIPSNASFAMSDIQNNGELIMLTLSGPETYYDYHGHGMGLQYLLCEKFAQKLGVSLRVEVCKDTSEMITRLKNGDADVIAVPLPKTSCGIRYAGATNQSGNLQWAVAKASTELADSLNNWFKPSMIEKIKKEERFWLSARSIVRHVYSPMFNRSGGVISHYDHHFRRYAPLARWDWRLLAAQCYQESTFDPKARSWAGACGLMQIMPSTADHLGLSRDNIYDPEQNIAAAVKYIRELDSHFREVPSDERTFFVLASYNGGYHHIRDAMSLANKHGRNAHSWGEVRGFVLKLASAPYYNDPVVKYGYMRGYETVDYVDRIRTRWAQYRGMASNGSNDSGFVTTPERAQRKYKWHL